MRKWIIPGKYFIWNTYHLCSSLQFIVSHRALPPRTAILHECKLCFLTNLVTPHIFLCYIFILFLEMQFCVTRRDVLITLQLSRGHKRKPGSCFCSGHWQFHWFHSTRWNEHWTFYWVCWCLVTVYSTGHSTPWSSSPATISLISNCLMLHFLFPITLYLYLRALMGSQKWF
jgi:hypothetical protein